MIKPCYPLLIESYQEQFTALSQVRNSYQPPVGVVHLCFPAPFKIKQLPLSEIKGNFSSQVVAVQNPAQETSKSSAKNTFPSRKLKDQLSEFNLAFLLKGTAQVAFGAILGAIFVIQIVEPKSLTEQPTIAHESMPLKGQLTTELLTTQPAQPLANPAKQNSEATTTAQINQFHPSLFKAEFQPGSPQNSASPANPLIVDRFYYLANSGSVPQASTPTGAQPTANPVMVVDRFYLTAQTPAIQSPAEATVAVTAEPQVDPTQLTAYAPSVVEGTPLPVPIPPDPGTSQEPRPPVLNSYKLLGVMEMAKQPVALFDLGAGTYSIRLGETIGNSGWTLMNLKDGKATVQQGDKTLHLSVGESFE